MPSLTSLKKGILRIFRRARPAQLVVTKASKRPLTTMGSVTIGGA